MCELIFFCKSLSTDKYQSGMFNVIVFMFLLLLVYYLCNLMWLCFIDHLLMLIALQKVVTS